MASKGFVLSDSQATEPELSLAEKHEKRMKEPWAVLWRDRGMGHGGYVVVDSSGDSVIDETPFSDLAKSIANGHNAQLPIDIVTLTMGELITTKRELKMWKDLLQQHLALQAEPTANP